MILQELIEILEKDFPLAKAESWDNCGLQAGRRDKEVQKVYIALDPTEEVIEEAIAFEADLLLTHHPMTLSGLKKINTDSFASRKYVTAIMHDLSCYAMHTNADVVMMATEASDRLQMTDQIPLETTGTDENGIPEGIGRIGYLKETMTLRTLAEQVKKAFGLDSVKVFGNLNTELQKLAICPGSGKSMISEVLDAKCDAYITGDIGHHDGLDAIEQGLCVIDAGHYGLEQIFITYMERYLKEKAPVLQVETAKEKSPFQVI